VAQTYDPSLLDTISATVGTGSKPASNDSEDEKTEPLKKTARKAPKERTQELKAAVGKATGKQEMQVDGIKQEPEKVTGPPRKKQKK